jgi:hypothetical protein
VNRLVLTQKHTLLCYVKGSASLLVYSERAVQLERERLKLNPPPLRA